jgi:hypothetical protein
MRRLGWPLAVIAALAGVVRANDIQPRLFTNAPVGTNFASLAYTRSEGNVAVDANVATDVEATLDTFVASYSHAFGLFGKSATFTAAVPYVDATVSGFVGGVATTVSDRNVGDPRFRLAVNLAGAPALTPAEFASYRQRAIVGFNLEITPPLGDYDETRAVNFGSNRWTITPELGVSRRFERFTLEGALSASLFSTNDEFLVDRTLKQDPILYARSNLLYHFARWPGAWIGVGGLYLWGGETSLDGTHRDDLQKRSRIGGAVHVPVGLRHGLQFAYSTGVTTRIGADFDNYKVAYSYRF